MLTPKATTGSWQEMELGVYELTEDWKNHQTGKVAERITFNNAPEDVGYSTATASVSRGGADNGIGVGFEIAHLMKKWYENPEENFGIKLAAHLEDSQYNDNLVFHSSRSTTGTAPYLSLTYTEYVPVERIEITGKQERIEYLRSTNAFEVSANVYPENATNKEVIWESTNESAAYYDDGIIWAAGVGTTTITAKSADNNEIIDSFELEVYNIPIETLTITNRPENDTLETGTSHQLSVIASPDDASDKYYVEGESDAINWHSSNMEVAYFTHNGMLNTGCYGTTIITASYGDIVDSFTLTVTGIETTDVYPVIEPENNPMYIGETWVFMGAVEPFNATDKRTICTSSNPDVVGISTLETPYSYHTEHTISALSEGTATIRLEAYNDSSVFYEFTVSVSTPEEDIGLNLPYNNTIAIDDVWQISTNPNAIILIGDNTILSNEGNGYIKGLNIGTTTIEISARENSSYFIRREITVIQSYDLEINNIPTLFDDNGKEYNGIKIGDKYESLGATITPTPPTNAEIVWSSSDESIAEVYYDIVRARVVLIGKKPGTVTIYAEIPNTTAFAEFELEVVGFPVESFCIEYSSTYSAIADGILYVGEAGFLQVDILYPESEYVYFNKIEWYVSKGDADCVKFETASNKKSIKVYALKPGNIEISAIIDDEIITFLNYELEIRKPSSIITVPTNHIIKTGTEYTFNTEIMPEYAIGTWSSSNINVGTIDSNGVFEALSNGETNISLSYEVGDKTYSHSIKICVSNVKITNVPGNRVLFVDGKRDLNAEVYLNNTISEDVVWTTSNSSIATVNPKGEITGESAGEVTITVKYKNDTSQKAWVTITVKDTKSYVFCLATQKDDFSIYGEVYANNIKNEIYNNASNRVIQKNFTVDENNNNGLVDYWNALTNDVDKIGYVVIICHANPEGFGYEDNSGRIQGIATNEISERLEEKHMEGLILFACNAGHLDYERNLATEFSKIINKAPVIASDGTSFTHANGQISSRGDYVDPDKSTTTSDFVLLCQAVGSTRTDNAGWVVFRFINGNIHRRETQKKEYGTITRMIADL